MAILLWEVKGGFGDQQGQLNRMQIISSELESLKGGLAGDLIEINLLADQ